MTTTFEVVHVTTYGYDAPVSRSHGDLHLLPRPTPHQRVRSSSVTIEPEPGTFRERVDHHGNRAAYFDLHVDHDALRVTSRCVVELASRPSPAPSGPWESVRDDVASSGSVEAMEFSLPSLRVVPSSALAAYAAPDFVPGRDLVDAAVALNHRVHTEFEFDPKATTVSTPIDVVLKKRAGVCQDFAHLMIGCLRSLGLSSRYVSGYLETLPPPGEEKMQGADASHAWVQVWLGGDLWLDLDPTNDVVVDDRHVTIAWGRDFDDVTPLKGVIFTDAEKNTLDVAVDVTRR